MNNSFVFAVQGEGRGHLTQAIATYEMLVARGHTVKAVLVGSSKRREIPAFFKQRIKAPIISYQSPNFVTDTNNKSIRIAATVSHNLTRWNTFRNSIRTIRRVLDQEQPDILLNFYEPLIGLGSLFRPMHPHIVSVAHQFIYLHPEFSFPASGSRSDAAAIKWYTQLTARGSARLLALSFYPMKASTYKRIVIAPPLLRGELAGLEQYTGKHILVYLLNAGYMQDIIDWSNQHPQVELHCFTDSPTVKGSWQHSDHLVFHSLDDQKFLCYMASAQALVTTAGFESVCEAMYLGKPVMMVPVEGHFEQWCNARDGAKAGAGVYAQKFDLDVLLQYLPTHKHNREAFATWTEQSGPLLLQTLSEVLHQPMDTNVPATNPTIPGLLSGLPPAGTA